MSDTTAVIVAAGRGVRMGPRGKLTPKGLIEIGGHRLVERSVGLLHAAGVGRVRIVTGHLNEQYEAAFAGRAGVELVHNPHFAETGSLRSLMTGIEGLAGNLIILESDIVYEARALDPMVLGDSALLISGETRATDEVYIWGRSGEGRRPAFVTMSKDKNHLGEPHIGELVGITSVSGGNVPVLLDAVQSLLAEDPRSDYEPGIIRMAQAVELPCHLISDLAWMEIDDEAMLSRAREKVWPRIEANDAMRLAG